jgi:GR25 family glycosyltransferase involved in LPS biosynthesis
MLRISLNNLYPEVGVIYLPKRKEYIFDTLMNMNIKITMPFPAILGINLDRDLLIKQGILHKDCKLRINEIACALSHLNLIKKFYNESLNDKIMIFEDDIEYNSDYYNKMKNLMIPDDHEFIQYGACWDVCRTKQQVKPDVYITEHPLCGHSYAINKKGAKKILDNAYPILLPIDVYYVSLTKLGNVNSNMNNITQYLYNVKPKNIDYLVIYTILPRVFNQLKASNLENKSLDIQKSNLGNDDLSLECQEDLFYLYFINYKFYITLTIIILICIIIYFSLNKYF